MAIRAVSIAQRVMPDDFSARGRYAPATRNLSRCPIEFDRNGNENVVRHADDDENESDAVLVMRPQFLPMFLLKRGRVPAVAKDDHDLDRSPGLDQPCFDLTHDPGEGLRLLAAPPFRDGQQNRPGRIGQMTGDDHDFRRKPAASLLRR